ncbi:phosphoesterase PA-phosphatase [Siphonobacter sp. BAB-5405]|uniref:phosphatase PAP2 family protein n=1 Tax=Siphonobacter sp. BAB-5405 TaxID=1864825 RepID=UPI000C7FCF85|nr:phosphatase PAP2 family protein [Siphonobacter sp. BAB-5405]PMD96505.1 phosphoesterase PA-phosphatase [Siphonobacter sp. BAB-5405]
MLRLLLLLCLYLGLHTGVYAQIDSTARKKPVWKSFIAPVTLMTAGLVTQGAISREVRREVRSAFPNFHTPADDYLQYVPTLVPLGLGALGVKGKHALKDQLILMVLSQGVAQSVTQGMKHLVRYPRPNGEDNLSFPSGHTTFAFTGAAVLAKEYGERSIWYSIGGYGVATGVASLRVINNEHWLADVLFSAGLSIAATEGVYRIYPWIQRKILRKLFRQKNMALMPYYSGSAYGVAMVMPL